MKGVHYLQEQGLLGTSVDDIAEFFHNDERLDKVRTWTGWNGPRREKTCLANNTGAVQPAHLRSLISAFVIRF